MVAEVSTAAHSTLLVQFARAPVEGEVKTRLIPRLGARGACELHCELVEWTCRQLLEPDIGDVELHVAGDASHALFIRCQEIGGNRVVVQRGRDLGERMHHAIADGLARYERVLLVGSDCPGIDGAYLQRALDALEDVPLVLGPALDGGYVLIGARAIEASFFRGVDWGSDRVYAQTVSRLEEQGWCYERLPALADIDRPEDLPIWDALHRGWSAAEDSAPDCS